MADLTQESVADPSPPPPPPPPSPAAQSPPGFESFSGEHETPRPIEDRIRFAIRASSRQPQTTGRIINAPGSTLTSLIDPIVGERLNNQKRDVTHLAKALEMDVDGNKTDVDNNGVFFDCNMCLGMAKDPILTCCGHLFCWGCFYNVPYIDSVSKECPVCNGEVTDSNIIPVYGNGNGKNSEALESNSGVRIPPRPPARRVESIGQQSLGNNQVADAIRRIRIGLAMMEESQPPLSGINGSSVVQASVSVQPEGRRYGGSVEIDLAVSSSRRRRRRRLRMIRAALARIC